jgi:hypothetical protein
MFQWADGLTEWIVERSGEIDRNKPTSIPIYTVSSYPIYIYIYIYSTSKHVPNSGERSSA